MRFAQFHAGFGRYGAPVCPGFAHKKTDTQKPGVCLFVCTMVLGLQQQAAGAVHNGACHLRGFIRKQKRRYIAHFDGGAVFLRRDEQALFLRLFGALVKIRAVGDDIAG